MKARKRWPDIHVGDKSGNLVVLERAENGMSNYGPHSRWKCLCELCGSVTIKDAAKLKNGKYLTCSKCARKKHGLSRDRIYPVWQAMIRRCENPQNEHYKEYGGRGIIVCKEWHDVKKFSKWAYDNGYNPNAPTWKCTIERKDVNGNYCPENCYWADMVTQGRNKRSNRRLNINGKTMTITEVCQKYGILESTLDRRLKHGWSIEKAVNTPVTRNGGNKKAIKCVNDGSVYDCLNSAAIAYNISYDKLRRVVDTEKKVEGLQFVSALKEKEGDAQ